MRRILFIAALFASVCAGAQKFTEASSLTLTGKLFYDTPNPYHRVDTCRFKGFTTVENGQVRMSSGIGVAFRTDSKTLSVRTVYANQSFPGNTNGISARGYDLYIRQNGYWYYAASGVAPEKDPGKAVTLVGSLPEGVKECLLYLPLYSEENSVKIGVDDNAMIEAMENPFRHRVAIFGSSYTHGSSTSRNGMTYPAIFSRRTGIQMLSLGCSGNSKLQTYFADVLCAVQADAFVFDGFSNPSAEMIQERLFPFIEKLRAAHPGVPLIFQQTIYREGRRFNTSAENKEAAKMAMADSLMKIAVKRYPDVYFIVPDAVDHKSHYSTVDGVHPDNYGYFLWEQSIEKPLLKILRKYGIK